MATTYKDAVERFGLMTVFNAICVPVEELKGDSETIETYFKNKTITAIRDEVIAFAAKEGNKGKWVKLDTLKTSNLTQDGPTKTVTGGQYANPLIKYGKTARLEMTDALGNARALEILGGANYDSDTGNILLTSNFPGPVAIVGDVPLIAQVDGKQHKMHVVIPQYLPDAVISFAFDAEGDASTFDLNGDVLMTDIGGSDEGVFFGFVKAEENMKTVKVNASTTAVVNGASKVESLKDSIATASLSSSTVTITGVAVGSTTVEVKDSAEHILASIDVTVTAA